MSHCLSANGSSTHCGGRSGSGTRQRSHLQLATPTDPDDPEPEYLEIYNVTRQGYAILRLLVDRALVGGPVDTEPTMVPLGGHGVPFVRVARIAGA